MNVWHGVDATSQMVRHSNECSFLKYFLGETPAVNTGSVIANVLVLTYPKGI
jgi:hypothetical protein